METVTTLIITALVNGMIDQAAQDSYLALKSLILRKYAKVSIAQLEEAPNSKARQAVVEEDLQKAGADQDEEVLALAKHLLDLIQNVNGVSKSPEVQSALRPEDLIERAERKAGSQAIGKIMEQHVSRVMDARSRYPVNDFDLLSTRLIHNNAVPQSVRTEVGRLHEKIRIIIEEVALRIEERNYKSSEQAIAGEGGIALADRQRMNELLKADKQVHVSYQALKNTVEFFSDLNQLIIAQLERVRSAQSETNLMLGNAILVYELTDFVIRFIEGFTVHGVNEIFRLHEETKRKLSELRQEQQQLAERIQNDNIESAVKEQILPNIDARMRSIDLIEKEWASYVETIKSLRGETGAIRDKIPTLEIIRDNAKSQINLIQVAAMLQILKQNIGTMQATILTLEKIPLVSLSPDRVRRLLNI